MNKEKILKDEANACDFKIETTRIRKASEKMIDEVINWVRNHNFVRTSPCYQDTLKINGEVVPKLLREVSINSMHNDLKQSQVKDILDEDGNIVIGYDTFNKTNTIKKM